MTFSYVTLYQARQSLGLGADATGDDTMLTDILSRGTEWIDSERGANRHFDPRIETHHFDAPPRQWPAISWGWNSKAQGVRSLLLDDDMLAVLQFTNGDGTTIAASNYALEPYNTTPYYQLDLLSTSQVYFAPTSAGEFMKVLAMQSVWGYHRRYALAWRDTLDTVVDNPLLINATSMTVTNADGPAVDTANPRFQVGNLIRFGSLETGEYAIVTAADYNTNILTLERGANGSTAAQQAMGTKLYVWRPDSRAYQSLLRGATWAYRVKDVNVWDRVSLIGTTQKQFPSGMPPDMFDLLPVRHATA